MTLIRIWTFKNQMMTMTMTTSTMKRMVMPKMRKTTKLQMIKLWMPLLHPQRVPPILMILTNILFGAYRNRRSWLPNTL
jgi:hypothetical protein